MTEKQLRRTGRNAFTLVELLVVIAIIAVLISLISAAVMQVLVRAQEVKVQNKIGQLQVGFENFKTKYGVTDNVPSMFVLCETLQAYQLGMSNSNPTIAQLYTDS